MQRAFCHPGNIELTLGIGRRGVYPEMASTHLNKIPMPWFNQNGNDGGAPH
jgi:hypothetical protein